MEERDDFQARISFGSSEDTPPPADIREAMDRLRTEWFDELKKAEELSQLMAATPEEAQRRDELMRRIFDKLGIRTEIEELEQLKEARYRRFIEAERRYFRTEGSSDG